MKKLAGTQGSHFDNTMFVCALTLFISTQTLHFNYHLLYFPDLFHPVHPEANGSTKLLVIYLFFGYSKNICFILPLGLK